MTDYTAGDLRDLLDQLLQPTSFDDIALNGLQVSRSSDAPVKHAGTAVTLTNRVIQAACDKDLDLLVVHHGIFWGDAASPVIGQQFLRLYNLIQHDITLLAYHLPLDAHPMLGNSVSLIQHLVGERFDQANLSQVAGADAWVWQYDLHDHATLDGLQVRSATPAATRILTSGAIGSLTVITGKADRSILPPLGHAGDLLVVGEVALQTYEEAADEDRAIVCIGHHESERYGPKALAAWMADSLRLPTEFIDVDCPI